MDKETITSQENSNGKNKIHLNQSVEIKLEAGVRGFAEDKDEAKLIRVEIILPALKRNDQVVLDFKKAKYSTQSFVHALVGEALQTYGEAVLDRLEFRSCAPQVKSLVQLVVDYSLGGFSTDSSKMDGVVDSAKRPINGKAINGKTIRRRRTKK